MSSDDLIPGYNVTFGELKKACEFLVAHGWGGGLRFDEAIRSLHSTRDWNAFDGSLTIRFLQYLGTKRAERWHGLNSWSALEWAGAMAGEAGEVCNAAKKLKRIDDKIANINLEEGRSLTTEMDASTFIVNEVADTVIYAVLVAARVGMDLEEAIRMKFNQKSEEYGFPERIPPNENTERLEQQFRDISELMSDAGVNAMPLAEGVRSLIARAEKAEAERDFLRGQLSTARQEIERLTKWQPIETAPENEYVIVWVPNAGWKRAVRTLDDWWDGEEIIVRPTHWQQQPSAPIAT